MLTVQLTKEQADRIVEILDGERGGFQDDLDAVLDENDNILDRDVTPEEIAGGKAEVASLTAIIQAMLDAGAHLPG